MFDTTSFLTSTGSSLLIVCFTIKSGILSFLSCSAQGSAVGYLDTNASTSPSPTCNLTLANPVTVALSTTEF